MRTFGTLKEPTSVMIRFAYSVAVDFFHHYTPFMSIDILSFRTWTLLCVHLNTLYVFYCQFMPEIFQIPNLTIANLDWYLKNRPNISISIYLLQKKKFRWWFINLSFAITYFWFFHITLTFFCQMINCFSHNNYWTLCFLIKMISNPFWINNHNKGDKFFCNVTSNLK